MDKSIKIVFLMVLTILFMGLMGVQHFLAAEIATPLTAFGVLLIVAGIVRMLL